MANGSDQSSSTPSTHLVPLQWYPGWLRATYLMATHSSGISAVQIRSQLGLGSYKTAWLLCVRLRSAMVDPNRTSLSGLVEMDAVARTVPGPQAEIS